MATVLVIDDEPAIREIARAVLEGAGHSVVEASNGAVGLWLFRDLKPDLAIVDLFMPEKEGLETIREIRAVNPKAAIIAISGGGAFGIFSTLQDATQLGATVALVKPFLGDELLEAVDQVLNGPSGEAEP